MIDGVRNGYAESITIYAPSKSKKEDFTENVVRIKNKDYKITIEFVGEKENTVKMIQNILIESYNDRNRSEINGDEKSICTL